MSYLTIEQYSSQSGLSLTGLNAAYLNNLFKKWSRQIDQLTGQSFGESINQVSELKEVRHCGDYKFRLPAYQSDGLQVSVKQRGQNEWRSLTAGIDYQNILPTFQTFISDSIVDKPVVGIDFRCYRYNCECELIKIDGDQRWSEGLPDDLTPILEDLIETALAVDSRCYTTGTIPINRKLQNQSSESDQTRSASWKIDEDKIKRFNRKMERGVNYTDFWDYLEKYKKASIELYKRYSF